MTLDELKLYVVQVKNGSGCLFEPISNGAEYTYILTAKHLFEGKMNDENGNEISYCDQNGTVFTILRMVENNGNWDEISLNFTLNRGVTYFPHDSADAAILKIEYIPGFNKIFILDIPDNIESYSLHGFPALLKSNKKGNRNTSYELKNLIGPANKSFTAQLFNTTLNKDDIGGMSGGGVMRIDDEHISLIGIQSEMKHSHWANGQINFVPIKYFEEIIEYPQNTDLLTGLYPPYMENFKFLKEHCFRLEVDAIDENKIKDTRTTLRNQALKIIKSDVTPIGIRKLFEDKLLVDEKHVKFLSYKSMWIAWLEFLTIMNIIKYEDINTEIISEIFNSYRLKYSHLDDWTELIPDGLAKSDYVGLCPDSTVVICSKVSPKTKFYIPKGTMIDIVKVYDKDGFRTDQGIDPLTSFNFVHLDYFKTKCIIDKLEQYENLNELQLLEKLKQEYDELFK